MKQPVQRRLAAILAADVAGYSRLMGADEAGTARALREHHAAANPLVAQHGGRVVKTTGDGVLIEFGSVVGALQCAIALQELAAERGAGIADDRRMDWRIGIHLGDVLVEGDDILGDGVNIAARLEGIAEPGGICISEDAFCQVRGKIEAEFTDIGEQSLKNIERPLRVYRTGPAAVPEQPTAPPTALPLPDKPSLGFGPACAWQPARQHNNGPPPPARPHSIPAEMQSLHRRVDQLPIIIEPAGPPGPRCRWWERIAEPGLNPSPSSDESANHRFRSHSTTNSPTASEPETLLPQPDY
jgi:class 3 adenylate cyclase